MKDFEETGDFATTATDGTARFGSGYNPVVEGGPGLSSAHNGGKEETKGTIEWSRGADHCQMHYKGPTRRGPGGFRGPVKEFSAAARRRLIRTIMGINRDRIDNNACYFVGLTYPAGEGPNTMDWARDRGKLADRFRYRWGWPVIWRLEFQDRGAPHFHLIVIGDDPSPAKLCEFRTWLAKAWYEIVGSNDPDHFSAGTYASPVKNWGAVCWYMAKPATGERHMRVDLETGEILPIGHSWGTWGKLPIDRHVETLSDKGFFWMKRALIKYKRWENRVRRAGLSAMVPNVVVERLLMTAKQMVDSACPVDLEESAEMCQDTAGDSAVIVAPLGNG